MLCKTFRCDALASHFETAEKLIKADKEQCEQIKENIDSVRTEKKKLFDSYAPEQSALLGSVTSLIMKKIGYVQGLEIGTQNDRTKFWEFALCTIVPTVTGILRIVPKFLWPISREKRDKMYDELVAQGIITEEQKEICSSYLVYATSYEEMAECDVICGNLKDLWFVPSPFMNTMFDGGVYDGAKYNNFGIHGTGIATAADTLAAIKKYVYEEKSVTKAELIKAVDENFENTLTTSAGDGSI